MNKAVLFTCIFLAVAAGLRAQELNIGVHANPILTVPVVSGKSVRDNDLKITGFRPGYNLGFNFNLKLKNATIELDANYLRKSVKVHRRIKDVNGQRLRYSVNVPGNCYEFPVLVNFLLDRHDEQTTYNLYLVAGIAYEMSRWDTTLSSSSTSAAGLELFAGGNYGGAPLQHVVSPVIGFKINAILRNVGLVDYGLSWHLPLSVSGPYNADAAIYNNRVAQYTYSSSIYASASYVDFKLCYYFYSVGKKINRVRYRVV